ncbi:MAG: polysaccharide biosynthesis protein [Firmicutes bacterium]|nr:polysaccharide biosynthesis protein [Bacillota bacterium]
MKGFLNNVGYLYLLQGVSYFLPLVTMPYLIITLGLENYGRVTLAIAVANYVTIAVDFGFNLSAVLAISKLRNDLKKTEIVFWSIIYAKLIFAGLVLIVTFIGIYWELFAWLDYYFGLAVLLMVLGNIMMPVWFFQGIEEMKQVAVSGVINKIIFSVLIFSCVNRSTDFWFVAIFQGIGGICGGIYAFYIILSRMHLGIGIPAFFEIRNQIKCAVPYFFSRIAVSFYTSANLLVLGAFATTYETGYYAVVEKVYNGLQGVYGPIVQAIYPLVAYTKKLDSFRRVFRVVILINTISLLIGIYFAPNIVMVFTKVYIADASICLRLLLVACFFVAPSVLIGYPVLGTFGHQDAVNRSAMIGAAIYSVLVIGMISKGEVNAGYISGTVLVVEVCVFIFRIAMVKGLKFEILS